MTASPLTSAADRTRSPADDDDEHQKNHPATVFEVFGTGALPPPANSGPASASSSSSSAATVSVTVTPVPTPTSTPTIDRLKGQQRSKTPHLTSKEKQKHLGSYSVALLYPSFHCSTLCAAYIPHFLLLHCSFCFLRFFSCCHLAHVLIDEFGNFLHKSIMKYSQTSALVVLNLPNPLTDPSINSLPPDQKKQAQHRTHLTFMNYVDKITKDLPRVLLIRGTGKEIVSNVPAQNTPPEALLRPLSPSHPCLSPSSQPILLSLTSRPWNQPVSVSSMHFSSLCIPVLLSFTSILWVVFLWSLFLFLFSPGSCNSVFRAFLCSLFCSLVSCTLEMCSDIVFISSWLYTTTYLLVS